MLVFVNIYFFGLLLFFHSTESELAAAENSQKDCLRFCRIDLTYEKYKYNILDLNIESCTHLILNAYSSSDSKLNLKLLKKTFKDFKNTIFASKTKILVNISNGKNISGTVSTTSDDNNIIDNQQLFNVLNKFDGLYIHWPDAVLQRRKFDEKSLNIKQEILRNFIVEIRRNFNDKIIVATIGAESSLKEYFDFNIFKNNLNFVVMDSEKFIFQHLHIQNDLGARHISNEIYLKSPIKQLSLDYLAQTWIKNGFPKDKLLIYADGDKYDIEPRFKVIWSSLNKFPGILIDNLQRIAFPLSSPMPETINNIKKYEMLQSCSSPPVAYTEKKQQQQNLGISCYFDLFRLEEREIKEELLKIKKHLWKKCDRIIFQKAIMTSSLNNNNNTIMALTTNYIKIQKYLHNLNLSSIPLIFSLKIKDAINDENGKSDNNINQIVSNIYEFIQKYNLTGIEFIGDELFNIEKFEKIVTLLQSRANEGGRKIYQIGLQINAFKAAPFIPLITKNNLTWITHIINPISDASLAIYHQWNKLHEENGLNLEKVIIKLFPGIWKQNADLTFLPGFVNWGVLKDENPEYDILLNRKNLCLNETIQKNIPDVKNFLNLPSVFTIFENFEEKRQRLKKLLEISNEDEVIKIIGLNFMFKGNFPTDLYRFRYETVEMMKYKIEIAAKHGFGGIALASVTDDDVEDICGNSIFKNLEKFSEWFKAGT